MKNAIPGSKYGKLTVIKESPPIISSAGRKRRVVLCLCECGRTKEVRAESLYTKQTNSCGCLQIEHRKTFGVSRRSPIKVGDKHGYWTALSEPDYSKKERGTIKCLCVCGLKKTIALDSFRRCVSCGCENVKAAIERGIKSGKRNNGKRSKEYQAYLHAKNRCTLETIENFHRYGGRGIKFLYTSFEQFIADVGKAPSPQHSIDRINNETGHYEPGNCKWSTPKEQANNRRKPSQTSS